MNRLLSPKYKEDHNNHNVRETTATQQILRRMEATITHGKKNNPNLNIEMIENYISILVFKEIIRPKM